MTRRAHVVAIPHTGCIRRARPPQRVDDIADQPTSRLGHRATEVARRPGEANPGQSVGKVRWWLAEHTVAIGATTTSTDDRERCAIRASATRSALAEKEGYSAVTIGAMISISATAAIRQP